MHDIETILGCGGLIRPDGRAVAPRLGFFTSMADDQAHLRYRRSAQLCIDLLSDTPDSETRVALLELAQTFMQLAEPRPAIQQQQQVQPDKPAGG